MKRIFHSEKGQKAFEQFFKNWDARIETQDDLDTQSRMLSILDEVYNKLCKIESGAEMEAFKSDKDINKAFEVYKSVVDSDVMEEIRGLIEKITEVKYNLKNVYELKNRRTEECFRLRAEIAKMKMK